MQKLSAVTQQSLFVALRWCLLCHTANVSGVPHSRHVCCVTWQTWRLCHSANMSDVSQADLSALSYTQQTCLLFRAANMFAVSRTRYICCATQQAFRPCYTADISDVPHTQDMSAVSHSRHVSCVTKQTCLLWDTADLSAVSHSRHVCCVTWLNPFKK